MSAMPRAARSWANATMPVLSDTEINARMAASLAGGVK
jgi:hypothetical protein